MQKEYDCIVIGAGPAGSHFAKKCAKENMSVLVLDKKKEIGMPTRCAEGLGDSIEKNIKDFKIPKRAKTSKIIGLKLYGPDGREFIFKTPISTGSILDRKIFDKNLAQLASNAGAKILTYIIVEDFIYDENKKICGVKADYLGEKKLFYSKLVVSCEGMENRLARKAQLAKPAILKDVDTCYQYEIGPIKHDNLFEVYFGQEIAPRGYIWLFPKNDKFVNLGIGIAGDADFKSEMGANPKKYLDNWIKKHKDRFKNTSIVSMQGGVISVGNTFEKLVMDNFLVIGTAAHQVDPIHGGGIEHAIYAADMASEVIINLFKRKKEFSEENLMEYQKKWFSSKLQKDMNNKMKLRHIIESLSDDEMNKISKELSQEDIDRLIGGDSLLILAKVFLKYPTLALKFKKYLI